MNSSQPPPPTSSIPNRLSHQQFTMKSLLSCTCEPHLYICCKPSTVPVSHIGELRIGGQGGGGGGGGRVGGDGGTAGPGGGEEGGELGDPHKMIAPRAQRPFCVSWSTHCSNFGMAASRRLRKSEQLRLLRSIVSLASQ